ncbi:MAG: phosphoribosylformylglycinamidine synthase subunit PurS [Actinomycetota bacterium]|nr:phosphoribosylformylglycinamidine synthase subunit PurS [Actinomycetota bacterium]
MIKADVYITLKKEILDTQGLVIQKAIPQIGYHNVSQVRFGKYIQLNIDDSGKSEQEIRQEIEYLSHKLLSNPIIEDFRYEISRDE